RCDEIKSASWQSRQRSRTNSTPLPAGRSAAPAPVTKSASTAAPAAASLGARGASTRGRAHGDCEASARREEEGDVSAHRRRRATKRSPASPMRPPGCGGGGPSAALPPPRRCPHIAFGVGASHTAPRRRNAAPVYLHHGLLGGNIDSHAI